MPSFSLTMSGLRRKWTKSSEKRPGPARKSQSHRSKQATAATRHAFADPDGCIWELAFDPGFPSCETVRANYRISATDITRTHVHQHNRGPIVDALERGPRTPASWPNRYGLWGHRRHATFQSRCSLDFCSCHAWRTPYPFANLGHRHHLSICDETRNRCLFLSRGECSMPKGKVAMGRNPAVRPHGDNRSEPDFAEHLENLRDHTLESHRILRRHHSITVAAPAIADEKTTREHGRSVTSRFGGNSMNSQSCFWPLRKGHHNGDLVRVSVLRCAHCHEPRCRRLADLSHPARYFR